MRFLNSTVCEIPGGNQGLCGGVMWGSPLSSAPVLRGAPLPSAPVLSGSPLPSAPMLRGGGGPSQCERCTQSSCVHFGAVKGSFLKYFVTAKRERGGGGSSRTLV